MKSISIGGRLVGENHPCYIIGEIGINHNGDVEIAKALIDKAAQFGFDAVKFQKRTVDIVFSKEELERPRESPFGQTNGDLKRGLEFDADEYKIIDKHCRERGIQWFCSPWDEQSVDFLEHFDPVCYKIASASLTDSKLLSYIKSKKRPIILSTGMSTLDEIDMAVELLKGSEFMLMHTTSAYPSADEELNLRVIESLRARYEIPIGYSGHEVGAMPSVLAVAACNACAVERHITLDRSMWGSDQSASLEPRGMEFMVKYIKLWSLVRGDGVKRVLETEVPVKSKLRRVG